MTFSSSAIRRRALKLLFIKLSLISLNFSENIEKALSLGSLEAGEDLLDEKVTRRFDASKDMT